MLVFICYVIIVSLLGYLLIRRRARKAVEPPRLPGALPLIGHTHWFISGQTEFLWEIFLMFSNESLSVGGIGTTNFGHETVYVLTDPEAIKDVCSTCLEKDSIYELWDLWIGEGLAFSKVESWKHSRKMLLPAFNTHSLDNFLPIFNNEANKLVQRLSSRVDGEPFDMLREFTKAGIKTIFKTMIGQGDEKDDQFIDDYIQRIHTMIEFSIERITKAWYHIPAIYNLTGKRVREQNVMKTINDISLQAIEKRKQYVKNNNMNTKCTTTATGLPSKLFIDLLIENHSKSNISEYHMIQHINTIIFAGYDTSAASLMYTLILLGSHPEEQNKVVEEIKAVVGNERNVLKEHISKLVYTEAVIKEAMRLYPFVSFLGRYVDRDVKLKNYTLLKGARCMMLIYGMHRNSMWGPDAEKFQPKRWLDPSSLPECPAAFAAFSYGKRACIGKTYAMMSMKTTLVHVLRNYRFMSDISKLELKFRGVLEPKSGHLVTIHRRNDDDRCE